MNKTIIKTCPQCQKPFQQYRSQNRTCCSRECAVAARTSTRITSTCRHCGESFDQYPSQKKLYCSRKCYHEDSKLAPIRCRCCDKPFKPRSNLTVYCSWECSREHKPKTITETCPQCAKPFQRWVSQPQKYCSKQCYLDATGQMLSCGHCGSSVRVPRAKVLKYTTHYCSASCHHKARSIIEKERWASLSPEQQAELLTERFETDKGPNGLEALLAQHLPDNIVYTGDHRFWVRLKTRAKNPDFVVRPFRQTKKVIEVFGDYWHTKEEAVELIAEYQGVGVGCVVLMEHDIRDDPKAAAERALSILHV